MFCTAVLLNRATTFKYSLSVISGNCSFFGICNVSEEISMHIFVFHGGYCSYIWRCSNKKTVVLHKPAIWYKSDASPIVFIQRAARSARSWKKGMMKRGKRSRECLLSLSPYPSHPVLPPRAVPRPVFWRQGTIQIKIYDGECRLRTGISKAKKLQPD